MSVTSSIANWRFSRSIRLDALAQGVALQPLHREVVVAAAHADVVHAHDVRMRQAAGDFRFGEKAFLRRGAEQQVLAQHLDRDVFVLEAIARGVHVAHAALPEHRADLQTTRQHRAGLHAHDVSTRWRARRHLGAGTHDGRRGVVRGLRVATGLRHELVGFDQLRELRLPVAALRIGLRLDQPFLDHRQPLAVDACHVAVSSLPDSPRFASADSLFIVRPYPQVARPATGHPRAPHEIAPPAAGASSSDCRLASPRDRRNPQGRRQPAARAIRERDPAAVRLDDLATHRQAEAGARRLRRVERQQRVA